MGKQDLSVFLDGAPHAAVSDLAYFFGRNLHFLLVQTQDLLMLKAKKGETLPTACSVFLMTLRFPLILALLTGKGSILKARWRVT